ncbi:hypothetical protein F4677DRAFT_385612 [Hypoxylon crocopeplum]|nr:hypothetical protein F4677DRAFT_385612 [Hypoxylon crocopeplum]
MEAPRERARASWGDAQQIRSDIMAKLSSLKKERGTANTTSRFEEVEQTMAEFRLACMNVIAYDYEYAAGKNVEHFLWQAHTFLNGEYRKVMGRLMAQNQVVVRRKLEKHYRGFLRTSQSFYRVYIQQLSGRFYIPELHQVASGTDIETPNIPSPDSTPPSQLRTLILKSCEITLVHLGDLMRYRCQMSDKPSNPSVSFDKAMEYYGLANAIDPDDGSAHHQLAVLYQLQGQHLNIVYHFHRSICIAKPHDLGLVNLEREFKGLENTSNGRNGPAKDPSLPMITWFLRLHAHYFHGEPFSAQSELEKEVLHRMEMAMKSDTDEALLRKMIFINIAAYDIALTKVRTSWTIQGSQSAQFLLRFNIRTILVILRLLKVRLLDELATSPTSEHEDANIENDESPICFNQILMRLFPLFRIYISWMYISSVDVGNYRDFLEPYVSDVYRLLGDTLTLLNGSIDQAITTTTSKYMLPEDTEALGLRPFLDQSLPLFIKAEDILPPHSPKKYQACKPHQKTVGRQYNPHTEAVWRIRDILYCGVLLAKSTNHPLLLTIKPRDGQDAVCWDFTDEASQQHSVDEASMSRMLEKLRLGCTKTGPDDSMQKEPDLTPLDADANASQTRHIYSSHASPDPEPQRRVNKGKSPEERPRSSLLDTDLSGDSEMVNMVNKLLDLADDSRPQSSQTQADTSYGMNTATANEVFGPFVAGSSQPSPVSKTIPNLPWDYFYAPTPHRPDSQGTNQFASGGDFAPRTAQGHLDGLESSYRPNGFSPQIPQVPGHKSPDFDRGTPAFNGHQGKKSRTSLELSQKSVLDTLTSSLYAQHGLTQNKLPHSDNHTNYISSSPLGPHRSTPGVPTPYHYPQTQSPAIPNPLGNNFGSPSYMARPTSQRGSPFDLQSSPGPVGLGKPSGKYSEPRYPHTRFQDVSSPEGHGGNFPSPRNQGFLHGSNANDRLPPGPSQHNSPWDPEPTRSGSSLPFSHPSSLYGGTPVAPPHTVLCNGNYFNASTPFGRLGPGNNNREDPSHFRNQLKELIGTDTYPYDRQVLESALRDDKKQNSK